MMLLQCLRKIADGGCCVILSIHHPNVSMLESMDHVFVIHEWRSFFHCDTGDIRLYFENRGLPVPDAENPADHMLSVTQTHTVQDLEKRGFFATHDGADRTVDTTQHDSNLSPDTGDDAKSVGSSMAERVKRHPTSSWMEAKHLLVREARCIARDKSAFLFRTVICSLSVVFAIVFYGVADGNIESSLDFISHLGALVYFFFCGFIFSPSMVIAYIENRPMYDREYRTGHYGMASLAVVIGFKDLLIISMQVLFSSLIAFWAIGFQSRFWYFCCVNIFNVFSVTPSKCISWVVTMAIFKHTHSHHLINYGS